MTARTAQPPRGLAQALDSFRPFDKVFNDEDLDHLAFDHRIPKKRLEDVLEEVFGAYWMARLAQASNKIGVAEKDDIQSLLAHLEKAISLLRRRSVKNWLEAVAPPPMFKDGEASIDRRWTRWDQQLLPIRDSLKAAIKLDGRAIAKNSRRRNDLFAAATHLYWLWAAVHNPSGGSNHGLSSSRKHKAKVYGPAVRFIHACLFLIDNSVTERLIFGWRKDLLQSLP